MLLICRCALVLCLLGFALEAGAFSAATFTGSVTDTSRSRLIDYTLYYPASFTGVAPLLLVSHGGIGSPVGHTELAHLGTEYAESG